MPDGASSASIFHVSATPVDAGANELPKSVSAAMTTRNGCLSQAPTYLFPAATARAKVYRMKRTCRCPR